MNLEKYGDTLWGISLEGFTALSQVLEELDVIKAIEFGSGISTQFLLDYAKESKKKIHLDSFDNDKKYKHEKAQLATLIQCRDKAYAQMFRDKTIHWSLFKRRLWRPKTSQKNCFYRIDETTLRKDYNLAIIDGPHGNGRNFTFLLLKDRMKDGYIFIDDFNHYDFLQKAQSIFQLEEICRVESDNDNFVLVRVL